MIPSAKVPAENKLRLVALYALRYERHPSSALPVLLDLLSAAGGVSPHRIQIIPMLLAYHHSLQPSPPSGASLIFLNLRRSSLAHAIVSKG